MVVVEMVEVVVANVTMAVTIRIRVLVVIVVMAVTVRGGMEWEWRQWWMWGCWRFSILPFKRSLEARCDTLDYIGQFRYKFEISLIIRHADRVRIRIRI